MIKRIYRTWQFERIFFSSMCSYRNNSYAKLRKQRRFAESTMVTISTTSTAAASVTFADAKNTAHHCKSPNHTNQIEKKTKTHTYTNRKPGNSPTFQSKSMLHSNSNPIDLRNL